MNWVELMQTSALVALALLLATGTLIPRFVVEKFILAARDQRIEALEKANSRREQEMSRLMEAQAAALADQSKVIDRLLPRQNRGD